MTTEVVISAVDYKGKDAVNAPFWANCYHETDTIDPMIKQSKQFYAYYVKFDGLKPLQITKRKKL